MSIVNQQTTSVNTPSILTSAGVALAYNQGRTAWSIQNLGQNPLYILRSPDGIVAASTTVFHTVLKGGTSNDDGTGGSISEEAGTVFNGVISVAGTSPRYVVTELPTS